ncbi:hypothetical protein [Candidatus Pollutiaquabacter sp.]|uniref:hypothetical protein n=1 Tax=Candidatus Pollutiaquabacter sp. TaxID=3416354 RepID=UPI003CAA8529|nr:hypothetical protein [Bacteroidota bacterium]
MMNRLYALLLAMLPLLAIGQSYNGPESAEFDYVNRRWLIGNTSSHQILSRDSLGNLSVLVNSTTSGPYGIEIVGDTVFCCSGGSIKGYLLSDGTPVYNLNVGGSFLNGLTHDNAGNLFATDFSTKSIIRVHIASQTFAPVATSLPNTPNGIVFDGYNNRCVFVNWGSNAPIRAIDLATYAVTTVVTTTLGSCDGITRDAIGRYYVSNWSGQSIVRFDSAFAAPPATVVSGLSNPADIFYNVVDDTLAIPNAGNNTVTFYGFPSAVDVQQLVSVEPVLVYPNPVDQRASLRMINLPSGCRVSMHAVDGRELFIWPASDTRTFDLAPARLAPGMYLIRIVRDEKLVHLERLLVTGF